MSDLAPPSQQGASTLTTEDRRYLDRARSLARRGWGRVHPNPMVGCVVVRDGEVVGEGWHERYGGPHAEVNALDRAGSAAREATVYVSLEPCDHQGKTPACSRALLEAGVRRVIYGAPDPGDRPGGGGERLRKAGVTVVGPVLGPSEWHRDDPAFFHVAERRSCYVALKLAVSLDGKISSAPGATTNVTSAEALEEVHRLRAGFDALMVGGMTARVDDPRLTPRGEVRPVRPPARIVLDSRARLPTTARLFREEGGPVVVFASAEAEQPRLNRLEEAGARTEVVRRAAGGEVEIREVLSRLWDSGTRSILCEGGGRVACSLLNEDVVRRLYLFVAPRFLGERGVPAFPYPPAGDPRWALAEEPRALGPDALLVLDRVEES